MSVKDLAIVENAFHRRERGANKEIYFLFGFGYPLLQTFNPLVDYITAEKIFFYDFVCPSSEICTPLRFYTITNGNNDIQTIVLHGFVRKRNVQKMHIAFLFEFFFNKDIVDMASNYGSVFLK